MFLLLVVFFLLFIGFSLVGRLFSWRRRYMYDRYMMPPMFGRPMHYGHHHHHHHHHGHHHHGF